MGFKTPLKEVRRLGSAHEGTGQFVRQRVTGVANFFLAIFLVAFLAKHAGADHADLKAAFQNPLVSLAFALLVLSAAIHMRIGMQVIIEDYVHGEAWKVILLTLNTFVAIFVAAAGIFSILKLSLGA